MIVAYELSAHDDGTNMLGNETYTPPPSAGFHDWRFGKGGVAHPATCPTCGRKTDAEYINPRFRAKRRTRLNNVAQYVSCLGMTPPAVPGTGISRARGPGRQRRLGQLVGLNCVLCGERIPSTLDGRFCEGCQSPVHNDCVRPGSKCCCGTCGATTAVA
jgi:hypothetical protein